MVPLGILGDESAMAYIAKTASVHTVNGDKRKENQKHHMVHADVSKDSISIWKRIWEYMLCSYSELSKVELSMLQLSCLTPCWDHLEILSEHIYIYQRQMWTHQRVHHQLSLYNDFQGTSLGSELQKWCFVDALTVRLGATQWYDLQVCEVGRRVYRWGLSDLHLHTSKKGSNVRGEKGLKWDQGQAPWHESLQWCVLNMNWWDTDWDTWRGWWLLSQSTGRQGRYTDGETRWVYWPSWMWAHRDSNCLICTS